MENNEKKDKRFNYILWFILSLLGLASLIVILYLIQSAEEQVKLKEAITFYHIGKGVLLFNFVVWFPLITNFFEWRNRKSKRTIIRSILKVLSFVLILQLSPMYFNIANGDVPKKFEKLQIIHYIRNGEIEKAEEITNKHYKHDNNFSYDGEPDHEDFYFKSRWDGTDKDGNYVNTAYLYSEDNIVDVSTGMYAVLEMIPLKNNWYALEVRLYP